MKILFENLWFFNFIVLLSSLSLSLCQSLQPIHATRMSLEMQKWILFNLISSYQFLFFIFFCFLLLRTRSWSLKSMQCSLFFFSFIFIHIHFNSFLAEIVHYHTFWFQFFLFKFLSIFFLVCLVGWLLFDYYCCCCCWCCWCCWFSFPIVCSL